MTAAFRRALVLIALLSQFLTAKTHIVSQNHPRASDEGAGTTDPPFKTISKAAEIAEPGDTIIVHAGTYRERVTPARGGTPEKPITYHAAPGEPVLIKGSEIWNPTWKTIDEAKRILEGPLDPALFSGAPNPYLRTISIDGGDKGVPARPAKNGHYPETLGQIFVNGVPYPQASGPSALEETDGSWLVNENGDGILINFRQDAPSAPEVELTVRDRIFAPYRRGLAHITIRGFTFEHCANQGPFPQGGAVSVRSGKHWIIEENTIRHAKTIGIDCGSEYWDGKALNIPTAGEDRKLLIGGGHIIRHNVISDNGLCGLAGWNHQNTLVTGNLLERNNHLGFPRGGGWEEWAAIKFHNTNALIAGNIIRDNEAHGIWLDNGYANAHITRNLIVNNLLSGIFIELGTATKDKLVISNNIIAHTRTGGGFYNGSGIYTHDASDIDIAHNLLFANAGYGVTSRAITPREHGGGTAGASRIHILNNLFAGNSLGQLSLPGEHRHSQSNRSDHNFFVAGPNRNAPDFHINRFHNAFDWKSTLATFGQRLAQSDIPGENRPDLATLPANPSLHFAAWKSLVEMDPHSVRVDGLDGHGFSLRTRIPELLFPKIDALASMNVPRHPGVTVDYEGNPLSGGPVIPGPFQNAGKTGRLISLLTTIEKPDVKTPLREIPAHEQASLIESASSIPRPSGGTLKTTFDLLAGTSPETWSTGNQPANNPALTSTFTEVRQPAAPFELHRQAINGPSSGPSKAIWFTAPEDGWYRYDIAGELTKRTAATAGNTHAELFILTDDKKAAHSLGTYEMNTPEGHRGNELDKAFATTGEAALKKGWHLGLRFQVISPGPAPGGQGVLTLTRFSVSSLKN